MGSAANPSSSRSPLGEEILDAGQLAQLREIPGRDGGTMLGELVEIVVRDMPPDLVRLRQLAHRRAGTELAQLAHRVAGSAASLGAVALRQVLHQLEHAGRSGDWPAAERISASLDREWEQTRAALQQAANRPPA